MIPSALPPLSMGTLVVDPPLVLAPMAGLTDVTFRRLVRRIGGVGLVVSEIVSSEGLVRGGKNSLRLLRTAAEEHPVSLQISGADPEVLARAALLCEEAGADAVDINMGCPAPKVTKGWCGAALLKEPARAAAVARAVVRAVRLPVTAKLRLGWSSSERTFLEVARRLEGEGVRAVTLHGRTREQGYTGQADWEAVAALKAALAIPVVGNGDVRTPEEALERMKQTACDGVMVGRAAVKNPWIFQQIVDLARTGSCRPVPVGERLAVLLGHFEEVLAEEPPLTALHRMKSFLGKYTLGVPGAASLRRSLEGTRDPRLLLDTFRRWAAEACAADAASVAPRGPFLAGGGRAPASA